MIEKLDTGKRKGWFEERFDQFYARGGLSTVNTKPRASERRHLARVKSLPCSVCNAAAPSEAHHIKQSTAFLCIPLCESCHRSSFNGIHGQARIWKVLKKDELSCLNDTIERILA